MTIFLRLLLCFVFSLIARIWDIKIYILSNIKKTKKSTAQLQTKWPFHAQGLGASEKKKKKKNTI